MTASALLLIFVSLILRLIAASLSPEETPLANLPKFYIGDKVVFESRVGVVTGVGREVNFPGQGPARKVWLVQPGRKEFWTWDFTLTHWS